MTSLRGLNFGVRFLTKRSFQAEGSLIWFRIQDFDSLIEDSSSEKILTGQQVLCKLYISQRNSQIHDYEGWAGFWRNVFHDNVIYLSIYMIGVKMKNFEIIWKCWNSQKLVPYEICRYTERVVRMTWIFQFFQKFFI